MKKAVIFDLDGTLLDTVESMAAAGNKALEQNGFPPCPVSDYKYFAGDGAKTLVERFLRAAGDEELKNFDCVYEAYCDFFKDDCTYKVKPYDNIVEMLNELKKRNVKIAVLSNKPHDRTLDVITKIFGKNMFDAVYGQREDVPKKPDPTGALMIAKEFGVSTEECIYAGDTNVDMVTGNRAKMLTVGVLWGFRDEKELKENNAHKIIANPMDIIALLD